MPGPDHGARSTTIRCARSTCCPTIADVIDAKLPWKVDGHSMFEPSPAPTRAARLRLGRSTRSTRRRAAEFLTFPDDAGFAAGSRAARRTATGDPDLRLYRIGPYGDLVGRPAAPLVVRERPRSPGTLDDPGTLRPRRPARPVDPVGLRCRGTLDVRQDGAAARGHGQRRDRGRLAGRPANAAPSPRDFWSTLPPQMFRRGHNDDRRLPDHRHPGGPAPRPVRLSLSSRPSTAARASTSASCSLVMTARSDAIATSSCSRRRLPGRHALQREARASSRPAPTACPCAWPRSGSPRTRCRR